LTEAVGTRWLVKGEMNQRVVDHVKAAVRDVFIFPAATHLMNDTHIDVRDTLPVEYQNFGEIQTNKRK
jgi:hypothetical protein